MEIWSLHHFVASKLTSFVQILCSKSASYPSISWTKHRQNWWEDVSKTYQGSHWSSLFFVMPDNIPFYNWKHKTWYFSYNYIWSSRFSQNSIWDLLVVYTYFRPSYCDSIFPYRLFKNLLNFYHIWTSYGILNIYTMDSNISQLVFLSIYYIEFWNSNHHDGYIIWVCSPYLFLTSHHGYILLRSSYYCLGFLMDLLYTVGHICHQP